MHESGPLLERAGRRFDMPEPAFDRLLTRRDRKRRNGRIVATATGLVVAGLGTGWSLLLLRPGRTGSPAAGGGTAPDPTGGGWVTAALPTIAIWIAVAAVSLMGFALFRLRRRTATSLAGGLTTREQPAAGHGPRARTGTTREPGGSHMDSTEKLGVHAPEAQIPGLRFDQSHLRRFNRWLIGAVVVLAVAVVTLSVVLIAQSGDEGTPENPWTATIDDLMNAVNAHDMEAAAALYAEDAVFMFADDPGGSRDPYEGREAIQSAMEGANTYGDWTFERVADVIGEGSLAASAVLYHGSAGWEGSRGVNLWWFDEDGKIAAQWSMST